ncbi:hypothetical protein Q5752_004224 [Cryptotrichosporon argae]
MDYGLGSNYTAEQLADAVFESQGSFVIGCQFANLIIDNFLGQVWRVLFVLLIKYWTNAHRDPMWIRLIVGWVMCMNIVVTVYYWVYIQHLLVRNFGKWAPWLNVWWTANVFVFDSLTTGACQLFFGWRAYRVHDRARWLVIVVGVLVLGHFGASIALRWLTIYKTGVSGNVNDESPAFYPWLVCTSGADLFISVALVAGYWRMRSGWKHTDKAGSSPSLLESWSTSRLALIHRLIRLVIESQLVPTCFALGYVIEYSITPVSYIGVVFQATTSKAYAVGLLYSLAARDPILDHLGSSNGMVSVQATHGQATHVFAPPRTPLEITIQMDTYVHNEGGADDASEDNGDAKTPTGPNGSRAHLNAPSRGMPGYRSVNRD